MGGALVNTSLSPIQPHTDYCKSVLDMPCAGDRGKELTLITHGPDLLQEQNVVSAYRCVVFAGLLRIAAVDRGDGAASE